MYDIPSVIYAWNINMGKFERTAIAHIDALQ